MGVGQAARPKSVSVRVDAETYQRARTLAEREGVSITQVIERAIAEEERRVFWREFHESVERLRADPQAWAEYQAESKELEGTLADGLDPDEDWSDLAAVYPPARAVGEGGDDAGNARTTSAR